MPERLRNFKINLDVKDHDEIHFDQFLIDNFIYGRTGRNYIYIIYYNSD